MRYLVSLSQVAAFAVATALVSMASGADRESETTEPKPMLLKPVDMALDAKQKRILERIESAKETVGKVQVVEVGVSVTSDMKTTLYVPLPGETDVLRLKDYQLTIEQSGCKLIRWKDKNQSLDLTLTDDAWEGMIYAHGQVYHVQPLGKGLQAISRIDQSKLPDEPPKSVAQ